MLGTPEANRIKAKFGLASTLGLLAIQVSHSFVLVSTVVVPNNSFPLPTCLFLRERSVFNPSPRIKKCSTITSGLGQSKTKNAVSKAVTTGPPASCSWRDKRKRNGCLLSASQNGFHSRRSGLRF